MVRPEIAAKLLAAPHLLQTMVKAGWIKPCYKTHRCTLYLVSDLRKCAERLGQGDRPDEVGSAGSKIPSQTTIPVHVANIIAKDTRSGSHYKRSNEAEWGKDDRVDDFVIFCFD